jgi:hypothetical protein
MKKIIPFILLLTTMVFAAPSEQELAKNPFLVPYVKELKKETSRADLEKIKEMAESELILLHMGYGTGIRNKWLHGNRDPKLIRFFRDNGIEHPDSMSSVIILSLWQDLNTNMTPVEQAKVDAKRATVARKRAAYIKLESECEDQLVKAKEKFDNCYQRYGLPSANPVAREPFSKLIIGKNGRVNKILFYDGASPKLRQCLQTIIKPFKFSPFSDDAIATLYILDFPRCRVSERDTLND